MRTKQQISEYQKQWYKKKMKDPAFVAKRRKEGLEYYHNIPMEIKRKKWASPEFIAYRKANAIKNKDKIKERVWARAGIIGITYRKYVALVKRQKNKCKVCKKEMQKAVVDHCHKTGLFRGIVCNKCNLDLGLYEKMRTKFERYLK